ncbi:aminoglycoside adenylyltransferase domain-containing protein [Candidatus Clostridium radicumherbarum]|uniref:Aminoglycoside adenylyltransferase domain-containing protein n=1 Tax=Candidatus Clostridium radicumherbarum TaxID=3381662 RepID=A0ABW8TQU6_9CLOT
MGPIKILDNIVETFKIILDKNLVGIYLHGSLAMGCCTTASDIDLIALVKEPIETSTMKAIIKALINFENLPKKGIEMSIVLEKYAKDFIYPTPFELHYSDFHKERYLSNDNYICGGYTDKDLAAHFTIIKHRGICLYGKSIEEAFGNVPKKYYIDSIISDVENAKEDIIENTVYITLNLCRVLYYLKEEVISSKLEAGNWAKKEIPLQYRKLVEDAVNVYSEQLVKLEFDKGLLIEYADYMLMEIDKYKYRDVLLSIKKRYNKVSG